MEHDRSVARSRWGRHAAAMSLAAALGASVLVPSVASAQVAGFGDVPADSPHAPAIVDLQERGVVQGKADGSFGPRDLLTRAQLASMLA
ncbi:S-layer homology domain-containing protein, partial [Nitriliruptoraceae bacterium ZYF776]|nr:S-layer homology domain-containing protein [Profundirhabdus halotolerans]